MKKEKNLPQIESFMKLNSFALIGASAKKKKFGNYVLASMLKKGYKVYPIHKTAAMINGVKCYSSFAELPVKPDGVILVIPPLDAEHAANEAIVAGIKNIWFHQGSESEKAVRFCELSGINVVSGECILMFLDHPGFPHNFHKWMWSIGASKKTNEMAA